MAFTECATHFSSGHPGFRFEVELSSKIHVKFDAATTSRVGGDLARNHHMPLRGEARDKIRIFHSLRLASVLQTLDETQPAQVLDQRVLNECPRPTICMSLTVRTAAFRRRNRLWRDPQVDASTEFDARLDAATILPQLVQGQFGVGAVGQAGHDIRVASSDGSRPDGQALQEADISHIFHFGRSTPRPRTTSRFAFAFRTTLLDGADIENCAEIAAGLVLHALLDVPTLASVLVFRLRENFILCHCGAAGSDGRGSRRPKQCCGAGQGCADHGKTNGGEPREEGQSPGGRLNNPCGLQWVVHHPQRTSICQYHASRLCGRRRRWRGRHGNSTPPPTMRRARVCRPKCAIFQGR
mmetsp:Transcript_113667/g.326703  ORF Transcript_113667/g.326703 Transcript_113667/m.326703 type:complete len:354 (+) Transcript_113667:1238-2299(+)